VVEVASHLERFKERREFVAKLTRSFLDECPGRREALARAVGAKSCEQAAAAAHSLVSTALAMGSERLAALARTLETAARENRGEDLAALLAELDAALARVEAYVRVAPPRKTASRDRPRRARSAGASSCSSDSSGPCA
jgi:HPt (histidine-containing phosphotransfer) domain-containing protein